MWRWPYLVKWPLDESLDIEVHPEDGDLSGHACNMGDDSGNEWGDDDSNYGFGHIEDLVGDVTSGTSNCSLTSLCEA